MEEEIRRCLTSKWAGQHLFCYDAVDSTNTCVMRLAEEGAEHGTVVAADQQNHGKGRRGRNWGDMRSGDAKAGGREGAVQ